MNDDTTPLTLTQTEISRMKLMAMDVVLINNWAASNEPFDALPLHIQELAR